MLKNQKTFFLILLLFLFSISNAQTQKSNNDSIGMYKKIQTYSKKGKFTSFLHRIIFEPIGAEPAPSQAVKIPNHKRYNGKIIRNINITTLDPFGFSDSDSLKTPSKWEQRIGNELHVKSKKFAIRNVLLFKKNTPYNDLSIHESERLIRAQRFANRATITEKLVGKDSVDVYVRVLDSWSIVPTFQISSSKTKIGLNERNFMGTGQQLEYRFTNRFADGKDAHDITYTVPNIKNSFVTTVFKYNKDLDNYYDKSISIERPFYSSLAKWAGGLYVGQRFRRDSLQSTASNYESLNFKYSTHDLWLGKAFSVFNKDTVYAQTSNFILAGRIYNRNYIEQPSISFDPEGFYTNEKLLLMGFGFNTRRFVKDSYIFRYGIVEDVPVGQTYGITGGYRYKNNNWDPYFGTQYSIGNYYDWGYLSTNVEWGSFFNQSKATQTALNIQLNYFTNLLEIGKWKIRQFIKPVMIWGSHRQSSIGDQLTINGDNGLRGFNSAVYGSNKMLLTFQTQTYSPKSIWGFRLNPYLNYSVAMLGNVKNNLPNNKVYSKIGIGAIISNDYLVFSSFQLSISYYPTIPFEGDSVFKTNAIQTSDFGFQTFELSKPKIVPYQ
ncbi:hypothetical protein FFWV33_11175 [Flavobacterium faecale]|uniref:POTRA domain-containing protein n=1 Tax=Flavobacterium faecale TaxID=1355330 RepID=A0A2S1LES2_9FLAO|nr:hypothetical protein [Flavobacterium faecale]AWG22036.1 hypothetical protein FFWV33_11175 [Flavobacterium faecale]